MAHFVSYNSVFGTWLIGPVYSTIKCGEKRHPTQIILFRYPMEPVLLPASMKGLRMRMHTRMYTMAKNGCHTQSELVFLRS